MTACARGVSARAVFIDIEAAPAPIRLRAAADHEARSAHADHTSALQRLADQFRSITFLTGSRLQIHQALTAFRVRTEHVPARTELGESGHSINHTTAIYILDPTGAVAGYVYHNVSTRDLEANVAERAAH